MTVPLLRVSVVDGSGRPVHVPGLARWLTRTAPASARGEVAIALVSDAQVRALNRAYRKKDHVTDVLAFPVESEVRGSGSEVHVPASKVGRRRRVGPRSRTSDPEPYLGDIVIARGVAARQAREAGHSVTVELRVLALHGLLHLLGYDHERDRGQMRRVERKLRRKGRLHDSVIERASKSHRH